MPNPAALDRTVARLSREEPRPVRVRDLDDLGVTPGQIRAAVAAGRILALRRGIVMSRPAWEAGDPDMQRRWALSAALLAYPGAFASHDTAGWLHGLPDYLCERLGGSPIPPTHITRLGAARRDDWLRVHGTDTPPSRVAAVQGQLSTDLVRTTIEQAARRSLSAAVVYLDAGMRAAALETFGHARVRDAVLRDDVRRALLLEFRQGVLPYARHRWVTRVRRAIDWADPSAESVLESLSRVEIRQAGLPAPRCGVAVVGDNGRGYWVDMLWDEQRVIGEADGLSKYMAVNDLVREKRRQEALEARGYRFVRWGWDELRPDPGVMVSRVRRALATPPSTRLWAS